MATANPFSAFDFTKFMADFKLPAVDAGKMADAQRKNFEAIASINQLAAEGVQTVFQRNAAIMRENFEEMTAVLQELSSVGEPAEKAARQADLTKDAYARAVSNFKDLSDTVARTNDQVFGVINKRFVESLDEATGLVKNGKNGAHVKTAAPAKK